ncbi:hypothetical protein BH09BAC5_BH09BAC5_30100 [soil metagenome]
MTIALLTDGIFPYVIGGMQRHSFYLAKYLAAAGIRVDLYHTIPADDKNGELEGFSPEEKLNIRSFVVSFPSFGKTPGHYIRESYSYSNEIWNIFKKQSKVDFIIVKGFAGWELLNRKSKGEDLPPVAVNFHGYEMFQQQSDFSSWIKSKLLLRSPVLFNMKNADFLFSYGAKITELLLKLGVAKNRILEVPTGISEEWLNVLPRPSQKLRKYVFSGRYERRKGIKELAKVIRSLLPIKENIEFHFIGPIPKARQIVSERIFYHGLISETEKMKNLLQEMDVLICPSLSEGMPNVVMEGLASGLAVIATDTGATSVMVNERNGWLIEAGNQKQLSNAIEKSLKISDDELNLKKQFAVDFIRQNFLWSKISEKIICLIREKTGDH